MGSTTTQIMGALQTEETISVKTDFIEKCYEFDD
jgi:hypothetical protein